MNATLDPKTLNYGALDMAAADANAPNIMDHIIAQVIDRTLRDGLCAVTCMGRVQAVYLNTLHGIVLLDRSRWAAYGIQES